MQASKQIFLLADIDDNLIANSRTSSVVGAEPIAWDNRGEVCGYLTPKQRVMLDWLHGGCVVVPITARSTDAYKRVKLPFCSYAITAFGGTVLDTTGLALTSWRTHVESPALDAKPVLADLAAFVRLAAKSAGIDVRVNVLNDLGIDMFLSVKHNKRNQEELASLHKLVLAEAPDNWTVHLNGNFLAVYPPYLGKEKAARWFIDNIVPEGAVTVGMGDSLTDLPFMRECDYSFMPNGTQNSLALFNLLEGGNK